MNAEAFEYKKHLEVEEEPFFSVLIFRPLKIALACVSLMIRLMLYHGRERREGHQKQYGISSWYGAGEYHVGDPNRYLLFLGSRFVLRGMLFMFLVGKTHSFQQQL